MTAITAGLKRPRVGWTSSSPTRRVHSHSYTHKYTLPSSTPPYQPPPAPAPVQGKNAPLSKPLIGLAPNSLRASPHPSHTDQVAVVDFSNSSANILVERLALGGLGGEMMSGGGEKSEGWGDPRTGPGITCGSLREVKRILGRRAREEEELEEKSKEGGRRGEPDRGGGGLQGPQTGRKERGRKKGRAPRRAARRSAVRSSQVAGCSPSTHCILP